MLSANEIQKSCVHNKYCLHLYCGHNTLSPVRRLTLKQARDAKGWTQEQLEIEADVNQATISLIENGKVTNPSFDTVKRLCKALSIEPSQLKLGQSEAVAR